MKRRGLIIFSIIAAVLFSGSLFLAIDAQSQKKVSDNGRNTITDSKQLTKIANCLSSIADNFNTLHELNYFSREDSMDQVIEDIRDLLIQEADSLYTQSAIHILDPKLTISEREDLRKGEQDLAEMRNLTFAGLSNKDKGRIPKYKDTLLLRSWNKLIDEYEYGIMKCLQGHQWEIAKVYGSYLDAFYANKLVIIHEAIEAHDLDWRYKP